MRKLRFSSATAFVLLLAGFGIAGAAEKENGKRKALDPDGVARLEDRMGGQARVSVSATGAASFVGLKIGVHGDLMAESQESARLKARAFLSEYSRTFGLRYVDAEVTLTGERTESSASVT